MSRGKLYGVSVGPGDPELMTLKAARIIDEADVVAVPDSGSGRKTASAIAGCRLEGKELLDCATPMAKDRSAAEAAYERIADELCVQLDEGKTVAYLCLGDIGIYSTYIYVHDIVRKRGYEAEIVPGVTSFSAAAATLGSALCAGSERLLVVPASSGRIDDVFNVEANKVFMKSGRAFGELRDELAARGVLDRASMVVNCGMPDEKVFRHVDEADDCSEYFSVVIVKQG